LAIHTHSEMDYGRYAACIEKLANTATITFSDEKATGATGFLIGQDEFYVDVAQNIDAEAEKQRLTKEIEYLNGFLKSVNAKLSNERFVQNAKAEIVANEQQKKVDAEAKIGLLQDSLNRLLAVD